MTIAKDSQTILLVDDDQSFREAIRGTLETAGYRVLEAAGGKSAQSVFSIEKVDAVISDIRMPDGGGLELLHYVKRTRLVPVILMTGFAELAETQEAHALGAAGFLAKPFRRDELLKLLGEVAVPVATLATPAASKVVNLDSEFCKVGIDEFVTGSRIQTDVYIRLGNDKYVKVAHQGEDIPVERIRGYKSKQIRYLYLLKIDFQKYLGLNIALAKALETSKTIDPARKMNFLKHTNEVILENLFTNEIDEGSIEFAKSVTETTVSLLVDSEPLFDLLSVLSSHSDSLYAHSLGVSLYGVLIAKQLKWISPMNRYKISMGGLLHDIGKRTIDPVILKKAKRDLSPDELKELKTHPVRGVEIISSIGALPDDVLQIVHQHHETCLGTGYPLGLKKKQIHPLARLISVANEFCNLAIKGPDGPGMPAAEAIKRLEVGYVGSLDSESLKALARVFNQVPG